MAEWSIGDVARVAIFYPEDWEPEFMAMVNGAEGRVIRLLEGGEVRLAFHPPLSHPGVRGGKLFWEACVGWEDLVPTGRREELACRFCGLWESRWDERQRCPSSDNPLAKHVFSVVVSTGWR